MLYIRDILTVAARLNEPLFESKHACYVDTGVSYIRETTLETKTFPTSI
jgi:hypothetical protein